MIVRRLGTDWWSRRAELIKSFAGQEVLCLTENFYPPDASLRRTFHHHSTSLCLMMHFVCFYTDAVSENNLWAFPLQCWTWKYPRIAFSDWNACGQQIQREAKDCFQTSSYFQSHLPFFLCQKKKNHFAWCCYLKFHWNRLHLFSSGCAVGSQACHLTRGPRHPGTPSWAVRRRGTRSRSRPPSWRRRSGWPGVRAPASRSSGPSTDTPQERRSHRAERDSAQSAETHKTVSLYCLHNLHI